MTTVPIVPGRGAWTKKANGSKYYQFTSGPLADGLNPERDINFQAINLAVRAIQARTLTFGATGFTPSGVFGPKTRDAVILMQIALGFTGTGVDGVVGPKTSRAMWRDYITWFAAINGAPAAIMWGMTNLESNFDAGAVGTITPDRGLNQINLVAHPTITVQQAYDPLFSINYSCKRLSDAFRQFSGKGPELQLNCAIAQHNSPLAAKQWYEIGWVGTDEKIYKYVQLVKTAATTYATFKV